MIFFRYYVEIITNDQRQRYKQDFNTEYSEYRELYSAMSTRMQVFKQLKEKLVLLSDGPQKDVSSANILIFN